VEALTRLFTPLWPALLALLLSHGVSFALNFLGQHEYQRTTMPRLMAAPYGRIVMMQFTLILGGGAVMWLKNPLPALVLLIVLKVAADLRAHYGEHGAGKSRGRGEPPPVQRTLLIRDNRLSKECPHGNETQALQNLSRSV
jgi:hypothetical protein